MYLVFQEKNVRMCENYNVIIKRAMILNEFIHFAVERDAIYVDV